MESGDPVEEAIERLAGLQEVASRSWLPIRVQRPGLVAADLHLVSSELRRLRASCRERERTAATLAEALRNAVHNLEASEFHGLPKEARSRLSDAFIWLESKLAILSGK